jgi:hypothetical protein
VLQGFTALSTNIFLSQVAKNEEEISISTSLYKVSRLLFESGDQCQGIARIHRKHLFFVIAVTK